MTVKLQNPKELPRKIITAEEMECGVFYKLVKSDYQTIYTKSLSGTLVWFEEGRIGDSGPCKQNTHREFIVAPVGTSVHLEQDACILS